MANYPGSAPSFTAKSPGQTITSAGINAIADEVTAIGSALLTGLAHGLTVNGQIAFPAVQNPSANANTLDDYEEGSWTPVIGGSGGTSGQAYTTQAGVYVKVGRMVIAQFAVTLSAKGTITTSVEIQGLPFTSESSMFPVGALQWSNLGTSWVSVVSVVVAGSTAARVRGATAAATSNSTDLTTADIGNTTGFFGSIVYISAA